MPFNINEMRSQLQFGGARPTLFQVQLQNPVSGLADAKIPVMCKATSLPASSKGVIEVPYMGRKIKEYGDRTFEPWTVTMMNDEDFLIKNALEEWSSAINGHESNVSAFGSTLPTSYKSQAQVIQYSKSGQVLRTYNFSGVWPSEVGEIELGWENNDTIEEFQVTFQYDWWEVSGGTTGDGGTRQ